MSLSSLRYLRPLLVAAAAGVLLASPAWSPAWAEDKIPSPFSQEVLIKTSLLTLNDANVTGNYTVLHAKLAKPFREQFTPDKLKQAFKPFVDKKIDFEVVAARPPTASKDAELDERGVLRLNGFFDLTNARVLYDLAFVVSEGDWKPIKLDVDVKPVAAK
jgi:hypothetical protein